MVQCIVRLCGTAFILITGSLLGNIVGVIARVLMKFQCLVNLNH
ncbi:hypothetical protein C427_5437 [Paraglaciecola psychrophila 170]|uniref:Uncharacterized protein n=1 Tax=Paraglaciecola psychrophila 170 TaxID=1129794 RepID=M4RZ94_9ALTE|nr:hypothetical protein C427_5437 [Paraglaciecola psychrophila 170]